MDKDLEKRLDTLIAAQHHTNRLLEALVAQQIGKGKAAVILEQIRTGNTQASDTSPSGKYPLGKMDSTQEGAKM